MQLAFQSYGSAGEPIIILHGLFGSRDNWHSICRRLAGEFRVFALDQRNHGESPHTDRMDYPSMAEDVCKFLTARGLTKAHLLGHSMGAKTAMQVALRYANHVRSLISVDMAPRAYSPRHDSILEGLLSLDLKSFENRQQMEQSLESWVSDLATRRFLLKNARRARGGFEWRIGLDEIAANYPRLSEAVQGPPYAGPALFLRGEESDCLLEGDAPDIQRLFPRAQMATVPHAGHLLHVENPDAFLRQVRSFLRDTR